MIIDIEYELYKMTIGLNKLWLLYTLNFIIINNDQNSQESLKYYSISTKWFS